MHPHMVHVLLEAVEAEEQELWCGGESAEIGGHWVARVEALVPPVYSSDAATSSTTTHTHHLPHPPETHRPTPKHASHTHSCTLVCLLKKTIQNILELFL